MTRDELSTETVEQREGVVRVQGVVDVSPARAGDRPQGENDDRLADGVAQPTADHQDFGVGDGDPLLVAHAVHDVSKVQSPNRLGRCQHSAR